jgi:hypothetical protein
MRIVFVFFFFLPLSLLSQVTISGKVLSDESGEAVSGASVYINNSTIGTSTDAKGEYTLNGIFPGTYEIIVSHVSFEPLVYRVEVGSAGLKFTFRLDGKVNMMRNILIMTKDQRKAKLKIFREQFLGITEAADRSVITNEEDILFEADENLNAFRAFSEVPLVIRNKEYGYMIHYELMFFYYEQNTNKVIFYGNARYEDLDTANREKWREKREKYYWGSTLHFYHSISAGNNKAQGFSFFKIGKKINSGKGDSVMAMIETSVDSLVYFDSGLGKRYLSWKNDIIVRYNKNPYYKRDLVGKVQIPGYMSKGIETRITMLDAPAYIDANGIPENPVALQFSGFWSFERQANMLPVNFRPSQ